MTIDLTVPATEVVRAEVIRVSKKAACMTSTPTKQDPVNARWNDRLLLPLYFCRACEGVKFGGVEVLWKDSRVRVLTQPSVESALG